MPQDKIDLLYKDLQGEYDLGSIDDFKSYLSDNKKRELFFNEIVKPRYDVTDIGVFEDTYGLKKKEPATTTSSTGYKSALSGIKGTSTPPTESGIKKSQGVSQSPLKTAATTTQLDFTRPQPRISAEEQQAGEIAATKGYVGQETEGTQLDVILANQKAQNIPLEKQMTSKEMTEQLDLLMPSTRGVESNQAFDAIFKKEGRENELVGVNETEFKKFLSATGVTDKYNNARMEFDMSDKERYSVIQNFNQSIAGKSVQDLNIVKARLNSNPAYQYVKDLQDQSAAIEEQIMGMDIPNGIVLAAKSPEERAQFNDLMRQYDIISQEIEITAERSGVAKDLQDLESFESDYSSSLLRSRALVDRFPNILKEQKLQEKADAEYEDRRARFKKGDLSVLPTSAMYVGASAINALNRNFYNSLASLIDNFGKLNDNTYSLGDWASKGLTELADNAIITPHKEFSKSGYNIDGYIVTKDKSGAISVFDKDFTPVQVDPNLAKKFNDEYDKKQSTGAEKETMYDFFSLAPQLADQFVTMYSLVGGGRLAQVGLQSLTKRAISQNTGMTAASYLMTYEDYKKTGIENGLSDTDAHLFASISAMTTSLLEGISPNENLIPKGQAAKALEAFTASVGAPIKTRMKAVANALAVEPTKEIIQEITQLGGDILTETGANAALGKDVFDAATDMDEIRNTAVLTFATTALAQLPTSGMFDTKNKKEWWQWASKDVDKLIAQVQEDVKNGLYTEEKAQIIVEKAKAWAATQGKIPAGTEDVKRAQITPLLMEKVELLATSKDLDKVFQDKINKRIDAIDKEIVSIMNKPVSEFTTEVQETTTDGKGRTKEAVSAGTDVLETGVGMAAEPGKEGVAGEDIQAEKVLEPAKPSENISTAADSKGVYIKDGEYGFIRTDGQLVVFETNDKIIDLGNKDELAETPISEFGIEKEELFDVQVNEDNSVVVEGVKFVNNFSNPQAAINTDANGNVVSVNLETEDGKKRTIRGQRAEEIAYQYKLKEFEQNATEESIARLEQEVTNLEGKAEKAKSQTKKRSTAKRKPKEVVSEKVTEVTAPAIEVTPTAGSVGVGGEVETYFNENTRSTQDSKYNPDLSGEGEMALREQENRLLELGADRIQAHGLAKGSIGQQFKDLINILTKGLDSRGGGQLYTAPLVMPTELRAGAGAALGTGGGTAYTDGGFIILAREGVNEIRSIDDIGGVLVNQAVADSLPELVDRLKKQFPNISIESYSNSPKAIESIKSKAVEQSIKETTKAEAQRAIVDQWNKQQEKEFKKEKAKEAKEKAKETAAAKKKAEKEAEKAAKKKPKAGEDLDNKNNNINSQDEKQTILQSTGDGRGRTGSREITPLEGTPTIQGATGPNPQLVAVAEQYAKDNGIDLKRQGEYVEVDEERAKRIADAYEQMANDPQNPKVKEAYQNLIKQTRAQYEALVKAGYKFWFLDLNIPSNQDYAASPYNAMRDLRSNKEMGVFPTTDGFGTNEFDVENNPMLEDTGIKWPVGGMDGKTKPVLANDLFRAVHDAFGHGLEGAGFRARGEENAWQAHSRLYTGSAVGAITTETRGQNSWVNFGPLGEANRKASAEETVFADQKIGLMPEFTWTEGRASDMPSAKTEKPKAKKSKPEQIGEGLLDVLGLAPEEKDVKFSKVSTEKINWSESRIGRGDRAITERNDTVKNAAEDLYQGRIGLDEYNEIVETNSPIKPITEFIKPAAEKDIRVAVGDKSEGKINLDFPEGKKVGLRLDIPAYINKNIWAITVHEDGKTGSPLSYNNVARIKNVEFTSDPKVALDIARQKELSSGGKMGKATIARMMGEWIPMDGKNGEAKGESAMKMIDEIKNNPEWSQIGMNPFRHSYFYDRATGLPVVAAEEVIQIGGLVYAKNAETTSKNDERFTVKDKNGNPIIGKEGEVVRFSKGKESDKVLLSETEKEQQVIDQMNKMNLVNEGIDLVAPSTTTEEIDVNELNSRLDNPLKTVKWSAFKGMPFTFTISDQLRAGNAVNPYTGKTIPNLKGGLGFNGTKGNEDNAWANTTKGEAEAMLQRAKDVYANNKPLFDKLWKEGKLPNGHVPMAVVKMAETSILSNEAVFRVGIQNIETLPKANRKKAVVELAKSMQAKIIKESDSLKRGVDDKGKPYTKNTINVKKKSINQYQRILDLIKNNKYDDIVALGNDIDKFSLPEKTIIAKEIFYGDPNAAGAISKKPGEPKTPVSMALVEGLDISKRELINIGVITDLLTEPSMKNVPNVHVISIVGVDVRATEVNKINHPNYPYGVKGVSIGVLKNPVHMKDAFGEAYGSALGQIVKNEANNASISMKNVFSQGIPVQSGLPNRVFKSAIAQGALDSVDKLAGFLRQAFPNTTFFTSNEAWEAAMADPSIKKKLKDGDVVYAFTTDGNVFINPSLKTTKATLHETGHIWMGFVKENNPALHAKGLELVTGTKEHQKAIKEYGDTELAREEALMELMSSKGDTIVNASQKAKFKEWLLSVYKYIADNFTSLLGLSPKQIEDLTLDKFLEGMLADVLSGKEITTKKIKGEVKFSRESQDARIKEFIEGQRKAGQSDKDIKAGLELVADKVGLTPEDINNLMGVETDEAKPKKGYTPKKKKVEPAQEPESEKTGTRAFAAKSVERAGVPIEDIPASLKNYRPTTVEEQQKIAEAFIRKHGIDNTITALRLPDSGIDPKSKPVLASVLLKELYAEQGNTKDVAEIEKIAIDVHNVLDAVLTSATEAAQFMAMMREFYNSNPYNYVAQVTRLIEKNINNPIKANVSTAVVDINKANKDAAAKAASNVVNEVVTSKVTSAKEKFERSKANLKALWKKSFNIGIASNQYEAAKNDVQFAKALTIMAKDFVVYQSVQFSEFLKEVAIELGLKESDIDQDHLRKIFEKAKSAKIQEGIKVGLKELELKLKDLIESHYSASELEGKLIDKLKKEFGVNSEFGLNDAAIKELEEAIKREIKVLTAKEKIKALKALGIKEQKDVNEILSLSEEGLLNDNAILETLGDKLGIKKLTAEEAAKLADLAKDIKESKEDRIKARNIQKFEDYKFVLAKKYKIQDFLISNYLTNIFGSLTSNEKNIAGNVSETILLVGELMGNALASGNPKDIQRALKALVDGNIRGFDFTKEVLTTGVASYKEPGDIRARNMWELIMDRENDLTRIERNLQTLFRLPYLGPTLLAERRFWNRALLSMDSLSGTTNNELGSLLAATREADKQKLRGAKRTKFIEEQMANSAEAQEEARNYAISAGYKEGTGEFNRAVANYLVSKRPEAIKKAAAEYSARATLTQTPPPSTMTGAIANGLNDVISKNPNIKFFVPVVNTFANLIVKNIERSPFEFFSLAFDAGRAASGVESAKAGLTKAEVARRMKTAAVWTAISVLLFALAGGTDDEEEGFEVFGSGTGDPAVDNARRALGWKPNTVRFSKDGGYYNFEFLPFGFVLGMIGNMRDYFKYKNKPAFAIRQAQAKKIFGNNLDALDKNEREQLEAELAIPGKYNISAQEKKEFSNLLSELASTPVTYSFQLLKSLGELVNAVGEGAGAIKTALKSITNISRGLAAPRYLGEVRDIFDNKLYDSKEFRNVIGANVPFVKLGNVKLDAFGREIEKYKSESILSGIKYALTRGFYNPPTITALDQFLWENGVGVSVPSNTPSMAYTEDVYREYIVTRGKILITNLTEALKNKEFEGLSPQDVLEVVNIYVTNANAEARDITDEKLDKLK